MKIMDGGWWMGHFINCFVFCVLLEANEIPRYAAEDQKGQKKPSIALS